MLQSITRESPAFKAIYHGKTIGIKFGGEEVDGLDFPVCAEDMNALADGGTNIIGITGAGVQISRHYKKPRTKIDGVAVTDGDLMINGVMPAQEEILQRLLELMPNATILGAEHVQCDLHPDRRLGLVGVPTKLHIPHKSLIFLRSIGRVGSASEGYDVNVNADDIARLLVDQCRTQMEELMLLTPSGGVLDREGKVVSLITDKRLDVILARQDGHIQVDGGMLKKLIEVRAALDRVGKIVITNAKGLGAEISNWMGNGTLCIDSKQLVMSPLRYIEGPVFDAVNEACVEQGNWRQRTPEELDELKMHHSVLRVKNSPLGGMSLVPRGEWVELSALWAGTIGNGMGQLLLDSALSQARGRRMYALCTNDEAVAAFSAHTDGYRSAGKLSDLIATNSPDLPAPLKEKGYDTSKRDPFVFLAKRD